MTGRWLARVVAPLAITGALVAGDNEKKPVRKRVSREDWELAIAAIDASDQTTVRKIDALKKLADSTLIVERGKVLDIRPAPEHGDGTLVVETCGVRGGEPRERFVVPAGTAKTVKDWRRWDRLSWEVVASVDEYGSVTETITYGGPSDLTRAPNPGVDYPELKTASVSMEAWRRSFNRLLAREDYAGAWKSLQKTRGVAFPYGVDVVEVRNDQVLVRFNDGSTHWLPMPDPQLRELGKGATRGVVAVFVVTDATDALSLRRLKGACRLELSFWRLREPD